MKEGRGYEGREERKGEGGREGRSHSPQPFFLFVFLSVASSSVSRQVRKKSTKKHFKIPHLFGHLLRYFSTGVSSFSIRNVYFRI